MFKAAICDDDKEVLLKLGNMLGDFCSQRSISLGLDKYSNSFDLLENMKKVDYDIVILDILMPGLTGMQAAYEIRSYNKEVKIIFITSSAEYAVESYMVNAYFYLLKPIAEERFFSVLDNIILELEAKSEFLVVNFPQGIIKLPFSEIECLEIYNKNLIFYISDGTKKQIRGSLSDFEEILLAHREFVKVHRSYIVNMEYIYTINSKEIITYAKRKIPVSRLLFKKVKESYMDYLFGKEEKL